MDAIKKALWWLYLSQPVAAGAVLQAATAGGITWLVSRHIVTPDIGVALGAIGVSALEGLKHQAVYSRQTAASTVTAVASNPAMSTAVLSTITKGKSDAGKP